MIVYLQKGACVAGVSSFSMLAVARHTFCYDEQLPGWAQTVATSNLKLPNILFDLRKFLDWRTCDVGNTDNIEQEEIKVNNIQRGLRGHVGTSEHFSCFCNCNLLNYTLLYLGFVNDVSETRLYRVIHKVLQPVRKYVPGSIWKNLCSNIIYYGIRYVLFILMWPDNWN